MKDTRPEAAELLRAAILRTPPAERIRRALELSEEVRALSLARLRERHPELSTLQLVQILTGDTLAATSASPRSGSE